MRVLLLGTGSADGWPNPFCTCSSCTAERRLGRSRRPSSAVVDDLILIDCGPTTPHLPAPLDLMGVEHLLITHGHPDHLHPAFLLTRTWTHPDRMLHVWGPASAIELCRDWCGPSSRVSLHAVGAGENWILPTEAGDYRVGAVKSRHAHGDGDVHAEQALLYVLTDPDGRTLLYATDTGPFDPTEIGLPAAPADIVLIDATFGDTLDHGTGHHDLATLPDQLARLRAHGVVTSTTRTIATHLSHHNPPSHELSARLAEMGIELAEDFDVIDTPGDRPATRTLVLGGTRSGKSSHAEALLGDRPDVIYIATGGSREEDPEWRARIAAHRARRPMTWTTVESTDIASTLDQADGPVLIDCLALWLTAQLDAMNAWHRLGSGEWSSLVEEGGTRIDALIDALMHCPQDVVLVSNEVGMSVVPMTPSGRLFADLLGMLNMRVSGICRRTVLMVAGRPWVLHDDRNSAGRRREGTQ